MTHRYSFRTRTDKNRKQRKARWIRARNLMRLYPECSYGGDFYCNHVYDPLTPWCWVDFRFFHSRLKRYFAVAMITAEYEAYEIASEKAWDEAEKTFPRHDSEDWDFKSDINTWINLPRADSDKRMALQKEIAEKILSIPQMIHPSIQLQNYGTVAIGISATVNNTHIDEHVIREWIADFRAKGEPTNPGWTWKGEAVEIIPQKLTARYSSI